MNNNRELETRFSALQKTVRRLQSFVICFGVALSLVCLLGAAGDKLGTIINGDVAVIGDIKCQGLTVEKSATHVGDVVLAKGLSVQGKLDGPGFKDIHDAIASLKSEWAMSRPYVAATKTTPQDPDDNTNGQPPFAIEGLQANVPRDRLPAVVIATLLVERPSRHDSTGSMDIRINGVVSSVVEIFDFGHKTSSEYVATHVLTRTDQATSRVSVTGTTYNFTGRILSGTLVVVPLGAPPK